MISISTIRTFMFCPLKLYLENNLKIDNENELYIHKLIKDLRIDIQDLSQRNIRKVKQDMEIPEIEETLAKQIDDYINTTIELIEEQELENIEKQFLDTQNQDAKNIDKDSIEDLREEIIEETKFNIKLLALKTKKAMTLLNKNGAEISEMFFPTCMYSYLIRDPSLELIGNIDKIEIINGNYIPIILRQNAPPMKGTWDSDTIEAVASAILIEQEFNTYVGASFVEYLKLGERRIVLINQEQRKSFFRILSQINEILEKGTVPKVRINQNKCENCDYFEICENKQ